MANWQPDPDHPGWLRDMDADAALESSWWQIPEGFTADPNNPGWYLRDGSDPNLMGNWVSDPSVVVEPPAQPAPLSVEVEWVAGNVAGKFGATPKGVILHGSRSGQQQYDVEREYQGTVNYVRGGAGGLGWSATVGDNKICLHMDFDEWGWNARAASSKYLAVEIAQSVEAKDVTDGQVAAIAWFVRKAKERWPNLPLMLPSHAEVEKSGETGQIDGKTDVFSYGSPRMEDLRTRIATALADGF